MVPIEPSTGTWDCLNHRALSGSEGRSFLLAGSGEDEEVNSTGERNTE